MGLVTRTFTYSAGAVIIASQHNTNENTLYNLVNGNLDSSNLSSSANIADTQLSTISSSNKVSGSALNISGMTTVTAASNDYLVISDTSDSNNPKKALASDIIYVPASSNALSGSVIQYQVGSTASVISCTTDMVNDDSTPQSTEGDEVVTVTITPSNASNILIIKGSASYGAAGANATIWSICQDSATDSIAAGYGSYPGVNQVDVVYPYHKMTAGTTSATTFKFRLGGAGSDVFVNARTGSASRGLGGVSTAKLEVWEIKA